MLKTGVRADDGFPRPTKGTREGEAIVFPRSYHTETYEVNQELTFNQTFQKDITVAGEQTLIVAVFDGGGVARISYQQRSQNHRHALTPLNQVNHLEGEQARAIFINQGVFYRIFVTNRSDNPRKLNHVTVINMPFVQREEQINKRKFNLDNRTLHVGADSSSEFELFSMDDYLYYQVAVRCEDNTNPLEVTSFFSNSNSSTGFTLSGTSKRIIINEEGNAATDYLEMKGDRMTIRIRNRKAESLDYSCSVWGIR